MITILQWNGSLFKIPALLEWWVVVTDPKLIDDLRKAPENYLSSSKPIDDVRWSISLNYLQLNFRQFLQTRFTFGLDVNENPYHFDVLKSQLNRALPKLVAGIHDEVVHAFGLHIPPTDGNRWVIVNQLKYILFLQIGRASGFLTL
jgi:hypothetical protein